MKSWNTYLALITSESFWESSSCFTATWDDKLLHILRNSFICSLASVKSVSKFCKEYRKSYIRKLKSTMQVIYLYRHTDVHIHSCTYLLWSKQIYIGIVHVCMYEKCEIPEKRCAFQILGGHLFFTLGSFP